MSVEMLLEWRSMSISLTPNSCRAWTHDHRPGHPISARSYPVASLRSRCLLSLIAALNKHPTIISTASVGHFQFLQAHPILLPFPVPRCETAGPVRDSMSSRCRLPPIIESSPQFGHSRGIATCQIHFLVWVARQIIEFDGCRRFVRRIRNNQLGMPVDHPAPSEIT